MCYLQRVSKLYQEPHTQFFSNKNQNTVTAIDNPVSTLTEMQNAYGTWRQTKGARIPGPCGRDAAAVSHKWQYYVI